ncbi:hypothetical protein Tco_1105002 [Tanacetum coccineum]
MGDFGNGYPRKGQKSKPKRQNRARERKERGEKSKSKPKVKKSTEKSTPTKSRHEDKKSRVKIARIGEQAKLKAKIETWDSLTQQTHIAFCLSKEAQEKEAKT